MFFIANKMNNFVSLLYLPLKVEPSALEHPKLEDLEKIYVEPAFGRTPYYLLYDTDNGHQEIINNTNHHFGGKDSPLDVIKRTKAEVIISSHLGSKPYNLFKSANYPILKVDQDQPFSEILKLYKEGKLTEMPLPEAGSCCSGGNHHH